MRLRIVRIGRQMRFAILSGQLSESRNFCQLNAANIIPVKTVTSSKRSRPPFGCPGDGSAIVGTPIKRPPRMHVVWPCFHKADNR